MSSMQQWSRKRIVPLALAVGAVGTLAIVTQSRASDHQQTPLTELNPRLDINDVYVFPGSTDQRIVLAITVASPMIGLNNAPRFDPNALYQIKVDNNQDGTEDFVFQFSFDDLANGTQTVDVAGPVAPRMGDNGFNAPFSGGGVRNQFTTTAPVIRRGALNTTLNTSETTAADQMQVFAGMRDDPFFVDVEQFFRIVPDRRPTEGPQSTIGTTGETQGTFTGRAMAFRAKCQTNASGVPIAGQFIQPTDAFDTSRGCAQDALRGANALAIVVELPESRLMRTGGDQLGVWATVSR